MATVINGTTGVDKVQDNSVNPITDVAKNIPCFRAKRTTTQTSPNGVDTKVQVNIKEFDTTNSYDDATNFRFTPTVAGYYHVIGSISGRGTSTTAAIVVLIKKNGAKLSNILADPGSTVYYPTGYVDGSSRVSDIVYLNGIGDYIELYSTIYGAGTIECTSAIFQAHLIVGA